MKNVHMCYIRVTEGKIKKLKKEGKMSISTLIFIYTIPFAYLKVYTKFHNPKSSSCWENSDKKRPHVLYRSDRRKIEKEGKMSFSIFIFIYTIHLAYLKVYTKFEKLAPIGAERSVTEIFIGEREKWINKGTDKQYVAVLLLHNTTHHYQALYQI